MNDKDFFLLSPPGSGPHFAEWDTGVSFSGPITCPADPEHQRAGPREGELRVVLQQPVVDFVWTWYSEFLLRDHVASRLKESGTTGFELRAAAARYAGSGITAPRLWEMGVLGWGGMAPDDSGVSLDPQLSCRVCQHAVYRTFTDPQRLVDRQQWDGSDIFIVWPLPMFIFCTARVADLINRENWQGVEIGKLSEIPLGGETLTPGRLADWFPPGRAKEIEIKSDRVY